MGTVIFSSHREHIGNSLQINMMSFTLQVIVFGILVNGSLGCFLGGSPCGLLLNREADDDSVHWTFGVCSDKEDTCMNERYDGNNITEITGIQLATMHPGSLDFALLESLTFPSVESMNCEELCNCLSCGHGQCSDDVDQDKCPGNTSGFICRCSNSDAYPRFNAILRDMMRTGLACRQCDKL